jgi:hypothetical protein
LRLDVVAVVAHLGALSQRETLLVSRGVAVGDVDEHHRRGTEPGEIDHVLHDRVVVVGVLQRNEDA